MKYRHKTISLQKMILSLKGPLQPLCNVCNNKDCSHVIENRKVSVFGVNKDWWVLSKGREQHIVYECDGYSR